MKNQQLSFDFIAPKSKHYDAYFIGGYLDGQMREISFPSPKLQFPVPQKIPGASPLKDFPLVEYKSEIYDLVNFNHYYYASYKYSHTQ